MSTIIQRQDYVTVSNVQLFNMFHVGTVLWLLFVKEKSSLYIAMYHQLHFECQQKVHASVNVKNSNRQVKKRDCRYSIFLKYPQPRMLWRFETHPPRRSYEAICTHLNIETHLGVLVLSIKLSYLFTTKESKSLKSIA